MSILKSLTTYLSELRMYKVGTERFLREKNFYINFISLSHMSHSNLEGIGWLDGLQRICFKKLLEK